MSLSTWFNHHAQLWLDQSERTGDRCGDVLSRSRVFVVASFVINFVKSTKRIVSTDILLRSTWIRLFTRIFCFLLGQVCYEIRRCINVIDYFVRKALFFHFETPFSHLIKACIEFLKSPFVSKFYSERSSLFSLFYRLIYGFCDKCLFQPLTAFRGRRSEIRGHWQCFSDSALKNLSESLYYMISTRRVAKLDNHVVWKCQIKCPPKGPRGSHGADFL